VYYSTTRPNEKTAGVVPSSLLSGEDAESCLLDVVRALSKKIDSVDSLDSNREVRLTLSSAAIAFRRIFSAASPESGDKERLRQLIGRLRGFDDIETTSALSFAARSSDRDLRLNAVLILGNIIDNTTVCVPLAHLNDSTLLMSESGINGRANLLGIVSVVAPWAYEENYKSIVATVDWMRDPSNSIDGSFTDTLKIIENIELRLKAQDKGTGTANKNTSLAKANFADALTNCRTYIEGFGERISSDARKRLRY
jgi:hypothetical protein